MKKYDYYEKVHEISAVLAKENLPDWSEKIETAIISGSTGTEILMAVKWHLEQLKKSKVCLSPKTKLLIVELIKRIRKAL